MQQNGTEKKVTLTVHYNPDSKMGRWLNENRLSVKVKCIQTPNKTRYWNLSLMNDDNEFVAGYGSDYYHESLMQAMSLVMTGETLHQSTQ